MLKMYLLMVAALAATFNASGETPSTQTANRALVDNRRYLISVPPGGGRPGCEGPGCNPSGPTIPNPLPRQTPRINVPGAYVAHGSDSAFGAVFADRPFCHTGNGLVGVNLTVTRQMLPVWQGMSYGGDPNKVSTTLMIQTYKSDRNQSLQILLNGTRVGDVSSGSTGWSESTFTVPNNVVRWRTVNTQNLGITNGQNTIEVRSNPSSFCASMNYASLIMGGPQPVFAVHGLRSGGFEAFGGFENEFRTNGNPVFYVEVQEPTIPLRGYSLQKQLAAFAATTGFWNIHIGCHSAGCLTYEQAYSKPSVAGWLPQPISVHAMGAPFLGSPLADYFRNKRLAEVGMTTLDRYYANSNTLEATNMSVVLWHLGKEPGVIAGLAPDARRGVSESAWKRLPKKRCYLQGCPEIGHFTYSGNANWDNSFPPVLTPEEVSGFPIVPSLATAIYTFAGESTGTRVTVEQVCGNVDLDPTDPSKGSIRLCRQARVHRSVLRPNGVIVPNDIIVPEISTQPPGWVSQTGFRAHHLSIRAAAQSVVASRMISSDVTLVYYHPISGLNW